MSTTTSQLDELTARVRAVAESENHNHDEVWDGVYVVSPGANNEHQDFVGGLSAIFTVVLRWTGLGVVQPGANVSDRVEQWEHNFRCPDVVVYLNGTTARNLGTHWCGGPDFAVEVVSKGDRSRKKMDFYAKVGTRELLVVDRVSWILEHYRLVEGAMTLVGKSGPERPEVLTSKVLPFGFRLIAGEPRPRIEVTHSDGIQRWFA